MLHTFILLLTAHLLGDFVCQTNQMVANKKKFVVLFLHVLIVTLLTTFFLGSLHWAIGLVFISHLIFDLIKTYCLPDHLRTFLADQALHLIVLLIIAWLQPNLWLDAFWLHQSHSEAPELTFLLFQALIILCAFICIIPVGGLIIAKTTARFAAEIGDSLEGLSDGGKVIGYLERSLVLLFILVGHPGGIGFLVAAKSILRFGDIKDPGQRKVTEYIIIGTFLSFGWALLISILAQKALSSL